MSRHVITINSVITCTAWMMLVSFYGCASESRLSSDTERVTRKNLAAEAPAEASISQIFDASVRTDAALNLNLKTQDLTQDLEMVAAYVQKSSEFQQLKRPLETRLFQQGTSGVTRNEAFNQAALGVIDIQVVIDNSPSMKEEQVNLAAKLAPLIKDIALSDWRINVVTTDPRQITSGSCSRALIKRGDANAQSAFSNAINAGVAGSGDEEAIRLAVHGLQCSSVPWLRPNSAIAVLIVSDEDNCSTGFEAGNNCPNQPFQSENYLLSYLVGTARRVLNKDARVYGLIKIPGTTDCTTAPTEGKVYQKAITASGGRSGSICATDYSNFLAQMSKDLITLLKADFMLAETPNPGSLQIYVNNILQNGTYTLNGRNVRFVDNSHAPPGSVITAKYVVGAVTPIRTTFTLGELTVPGSLSVLINGTLADPGSYDFVAGINAVSFKVAPPQGAEIKISFMKDTPLQSVFPVDARLVESSLVVTVDKTEVKNFKVTPGAQISFATPPPEGSMINVVYKVNAGPQLKYAVSLSGNQSRFLGVFDRETNEKIDADLISGELIFKEVAFREGRKVIVRYQNETSNVQKIDLTHTPLEGSLVVRPQVGTCSETMSGTLLQLDCTVIEDNSVAISWAYIQSLRSYTLKLPNDMKPDIGTWIVVINGVEITVFKRQDATVTLDEQPPQDAKVKVIFKFREGNA